MISQSKIIIYIIMEFCQDVVLQLAIQYIIWHNIRCDGSKREEKILFLLFYSQD